MNLSLTSILSYRILAPVKAAGAFPTLIIAGLITAFASGGVYASDRTVEERAIGVVKGFMHCLETGNSELCLSLLDTPYYQGNGPITNAAELRKLVEQTARGPKDIGLVEYSIHKNAISETPKLGQAYIDVLARSRTDAIVFRVKASDVFKIVGLVNAK